MEADEKGSCQYVDQYKVVRLLGSGYTAEVKLGLSQEGKYLAIKQYKHQTSTLQTLKDQLKVMKDLTHQNLIKLISVKQNAINKKANGSIQKCFAIVLEYAGGGQLFDFVAESGKFSQKVTRTYFHEMMNGIHFMHDKGYAHRDLKPQNVLLTSNFILKLADFGFSCLLRGHDGTGVLRTKLGTEGYMAPEIATKNYDGRKTDIFAAGVILFIMYAATPPFQKPTPTDAYYKLIKQKKFDVFWGAHSKRRQPNFFPQHFKDLVQKMMAYVPGERPTITQIAKHPWAKGTVCTHQEIVDEFKQRKKKMDLILQKRRKQKEHEEHRRNGNIHNQGFNNRDNDQEEDKQFIQIYNREKLNQHKYQKLPIQSPDDIIVKGEIAFVVAQLKYYLKNQRIVLEDEEQGQQIISEEKDQIRCQQIIDLQNKIRVKYRYRYNVDEQSIESGLVFLVNVGEQNKQVRLNFQVEEGSSFWVKRIIKDIILNCFP